MLETTRLNPLYAKSCRPKIERGNYLPCLNTFSLTLTEPWLTPAPE